jgi:HK97 family phage major capsid protein
MWMTMPSRLKGGAVWLINGEMQPYLAELAVPVGTAALEYKFVSYDQNGVLRIHGKPVIEIEQCDAPGTEGDIILVNLNEYMILTKGGLKTDASIHVRFLYDEMTLRWIIRINGRPKWKSALTKYKGSGTWSPIVTLAAS